MVQPLSPPWSVRLLTATLVLLATLLGACGDAGDGRTAATASRSARSADTTAGLGWYVPISDVATWDTTTAPSAALLEYYPLRAGPSTVMELADRSDSATRSVLVRVVSGSGRVTNWRYFSDGGSGWVPSQEFTDASVEQQYHRALRVLTRSLGGRPSSSAALYSGDWSLVVGRRGRLERGVFCNVRSADGRDWQPPPSMVALEPDVVMSLVGRSPAVSYPFEY